MDICVEDFFDVQPEMHKLILGYYADTNAQDGIPPLDMDWDGFGDLADSGKLIIFTARDGKELLGVNMYFVMSHLQHKGVMAAHCNTLAVATKHRGKGIGSLLVEAACEYFEIYTQVKMISHSARVIYQAEPLFAKRGDFKLQEHVYMKVL